MAKSDGSAALQSPIAIIGMGCLFPRGQGLQEYWRLLRRSEDGVGKIPKSHWSVEDYFAADSDRADLTYCNRGAFLSPIEFDPTEFGIPPSTLEAIDTSHLLSLSVAKAAMLDAGYGPEREFDRSRTSVILGVTGTQELVIPLGARMGHPIWRRAMRRCGVPEDVTESVVQEISDSYVSWQENSFPGLLGNVVAGRIANRLNLRGTNCVVDAACASALSAVHLSMLELSNKRSDLIISGGVDALNDIFMFMCFSKTQALSPTGDARPFSKDADGTVLGEGVGMVVLKRLEDARRDDDRIYAVIRGMGTSSDGRSQSIYAPRSEGQAEALRSAYRYSDVEPDTVELVEAHGTGTTVGDTVEFGALETVYRETKPRGTWCALGSVKSQIGHTKAAAGVAGLIKAALALHHKVLPPTIKVSEANPKLNIGSSPFYLNTETRPWIASNDHARRSGVSSFGFGGSNFHVVLEEESNAKIDVAWDGSVDIIAMSAQSRKELIEKAADWQKFLTQSPATQPPRNDVVAYRAKLSRDAFRPGDDQRLLLVAEYDANLIELFDEVTKRLRAQEPARSWCTENAFFGSSEIDGDLAFLFSGQGSQYVRMGRDLVCLFPEAQAALAEADEKFSATHRLSRFIYPVPTSDAEQQREQFAALTQTDVAQPALGAVGLAMLRVLARFNVKADVVAGHSYGELVALRAAGRIDDDTLRHLSMVRGDLMAHGAGDRGAMAAVQAPVDQIEPTLREEGISVVLAHRNSPTQGVLSGRCQEIDRAMRVCASRGWHTARLMVSGAFHSELMAEAAERFRVALNDTAIENGLTTVFANVTAEAYPDDCDESRDILARQLLSPINFAKQIENLYAAGARTFVEVGPRAVLTGLVHEILGDQSHHAMALDAGGGRRCALADLARVLARLSAAGRPVAVSNWEPDCPKPAEPRMVIPLTGANYRSNGRYRSAESRASREFANAQDGEKSNASMNRRDQVTDSTHDSAKSVTAALSHDDAQVQESSRKPLPHTTAPNGMDDLTPTHVPVPTPSRASTPVPKVPAADALGPSVLQVVQEGLRAMQALQQQTAAVHQRFLETQEQAQKTFQKVMESQQRLIERTIGVTPVQSIEPAPFTAPSILPRESESETKLDLSDHVIPASSPLPDDTPDNAPPRRDDVDEIGQALIAVISEKTGYPPEGINLEMEIEGDLGIDPVRWMDVASRLGDRIRLAHPLNGLPLDRIKTLRDVIAYSLSGAIPDESELATPEYEAVTSTELTSSTDREIDTNGDIDFEETLLNVVAELTGYPLEMLDLEMDLEADLGIDSIKRVEILATVQNRIPGTEEVNSSYIGSLRTLQSIIDYMKTSTAGSSASETTTVVKATSTPASREKSDVQLERRVLRSVTLLKPCDRGQINIAAGREILIVDDGTALPRALTEKLQSINVRSRVVVPPVLKPGGNGDGRVGGLIILGRPETQGTARWSQDCEHELKGAFATAQSVSSMLLDAAATGGAIFSTVSRMDGSFGLNGGPFQPVQGGLSGLTKTIAREWPGVCAKALDVATAWNDGDAIADAIIEELGSPDPVEVGLDGKTRRGLELVEANVSDGQLDLSPDDVVVISGGARGVTAEAVHALAKACRSTMVLLGRSPAPEPEPIWLHGLDEEFQIKRALREHAFIDDTDLQPSSLESAYRKHLANREIAENMQKIQRTGARVLYRSVDLRDADTVQTMMAQLHEDIGPIRALIHGAGVIEDRLITDKTMEQFERVFETKVAGLRHLLESVETEDLKHLVLFSSVSGRFGRQGQVDYAMANEVLNKVAQGYKTLLPACRVTAINWGPWDGGMIHGALKRDFERQGIGLIPLEAGAQKFVEEMSVTNREDAEVVILSSATGAKVSLSQDNTGPSTQSLTSRPSRPSSSVRGLSPVFERRLDVERHGFLRSHMIGGHPVLPVAIMLEWLGHGALHDNPGLLLHGFDEFRVLKGMILNNGPRDLRVVASKARPHGEFYEVDVELQTVSDSGQTAHSQARAILVATLPKPSSSTPQRNGHETKPYGRSVQEVYNEILFHGPHFHAIDRVESIGSEGMTAVVHAGPPPTVWMDDPPRSEWLGDPLVVDAGLQLGIVWCHEKLGSVSLPSFGARYRQYMSKFPVEGVSVVLASRENGRQRMTADVEFIDHDARVVARMEGFEWTLDSSLRQAFGGTSGGDCGGTAGSSSLSSSRIVPSE